MCQGWAPLANPYSMRILQKYDPNAIPVPKLPANIHELREAQRGQGRRRFIEDERMMRVMSAAYYGAIAHVDYHVGKLLDELDKLGMSGNTLVLFTADHGNMLGDHGRWFKGVMYEGSSHVPLIWRDPKAPKRTPAASRRRSSRTPTSCRPSWRRWACRSPTACRAAVSSRWPAARIRPGRTTAFRSSPPA